MPRTPLIVATALAVLLLATLLFLIGHKFPSSTAFREQAPHATGAINFSNDHFLQLINDLRQAANPADIQRALLALKDYLMSLPPDSAAALILQFLASGDDLPTGLPFKPGRGGTLASWPSLRVFLIDLLLPIHPGKARDLSKSLLQTSPSPDEWAVCLRTLGALNLPEDLPLLQSKTRELFQRPDWRAAPTAGYLEAFDLIVHLRDTSLAPDLGRLVDHSPHPAPAFASLLTLNRLVENNPAATLSPVLQDASLMQDHPEARAELFARLDPRDPSSSNLLKSYLSQPARTPAELEHFAETYPHSGRFLSTNLLTPSHTWSGQDLLQRDQAALQQIRTWMADPWLAPCRPYLQRIEQRLASQTE